MLIWNDYSEGEEDGHGHYGANCHYCDKGRWQRNKLSVMEAHLILHCKEHVPEDIRKKWLIEVAKRGEKANNDKDNDVPIEKKVKTVNQLITSHYRPTESIKKILKQANTLVLFFQKSHLASWVLQDTIALMNIKEGSLETYCEMHWGSIYNTTNSIVHIRPAIEKILEEKPDIFSNQEVFKIANDIHDNFYTSCKRIVSVFEPIKNFHNICNLAVNYYKDLFHKEEECNELVDQLIRYKAEVEFWNLESSSNLIPSLCALSKIVISEIDYSNSIKKNEEEVEIISFAESDITMALQSLVNLSD
ncbi:14510_t:CDS:2 [Cetraspora pellucida]|uniref:14510_t:CDS:1 n=1 Tax=Cetraspora pellucida TaxID=1433469 RepID=A0A9N9GWB3_9GLOM|nr:14510_t:CDS:2 [Cetraspora pellucida]